MALTKIPNNLITADAIDGTLIANNAINSEHYTDGSIDTVHIGADQITSALIADDQIDSEHIVDGSIDLAHMSVNSIDSDQYIDGSIDNAHLADDAVGIAELSATGSASSSTYLRGDNSWAAIPAGGVDGISSAADATGLWISSSEHLGINISNNTWGRLNVHESSATIASAVISQGSSSGNALEINDGSSDSSGNLFNIGGDGKVGIGTTGPDYKLTIHGSGTTMNDGTGPCLQLYSTDNTTSMVMLGSAADPNAAGIGYHRGNSRLWITAGGGSENAASSAFVLEGGGNVGIGTNDPTQALDLVGYMVGGSHRTDNAEKHMKYMGVPYHSSDTSDIAGMYINGHSGGNFIRIGGGVDATSAATAISFHTGALTTGAYEGTSRMTIASDGKVGIGTTSPNRTLTVYGSSNGEMNLKNSSADFLIQQAGHNTSIGNSSSSGYINFFTNNGNSNVRILSDGNVGIGVVPEANWASDVEVLQVAGLGGFWGKSSQAASSAVNLSYNVYDHSSTGQAAIVTDEASMYQQDDGEHKFVVASSTSADAAITWKHPMTIKNDGSIIFDNVATTSGAGSQGVIAHHTNNNMYIRGGTESLILGGGSSSEASRGSISIPEGNNNMDFKISDTTRFRVRHDGMTFMGPNTSGQMHVSYNSSYVTMADDATITLSSVANTGCLISIGSYRKSGQNVAYAHALIFLGYHIGTTAGTIIADPVGFLRNSDTDGYMCVYKTAGNGNVTVKNRLGISNNVSITIHRYLGN